MLTSLLPTTEANFPPLTKNSMPYEVAKNALIFRNTMQRQKNLLWSDGTFARAEKELTTEDIENLQNSLAQTAFKWDFEVGGFRMQLLIEPINMRNDRDQFLARINVIDIDPVKAHPNTMMLLGIYIYPADLRKDNAFFFATICAKEIMARRKPFGHLWTTDANLVPLPANVTLYAHGGYENTLEGIDGLAIQMMKRKDGLGHRNPSSMASPASGEALTWMREQANKLSRPNMNLRLIGKNESTAFMSLENSVSHSRVVEKALRPYAKGPFPLKWHDFTNDRPKTLEVNCAVNARIANVLSHLFCFGRLKQTQLIDIATLIEAKDLAFQLKADEFYWALAQVAGILAVIDDTYAPVPFFDTCYEILKDKPINVFIDYNKDGDRVKLAGHLILLSCITFIAHETGGLQNIPHKLLHSNLGLHNLLTDMKEAFELSLWQNPDGIKDCS